MMGVTMVKARLPCEAVGRTPLTRCVGWPSSPRTHLGRSRRLSSSPPAPLVKVTGHAKLVYDLVGLKDVHVSISHCDGHAIAQSLAV